MAENISMILENYTNDLCKIYGNHLKKIILYGSYARGDNRKNSDIDIMILVDLQDEQMEALSDVLSEHDFAENGTKEDLVMHRLAVVREDLDKAYILLDLKKYRGANNRAY